MNNDLITYIIIIPIMFILVFLFPGLLLFKCPPKEPNDLLGFRTGRSSKSQETWDYANYYAGKGILISGVIFLIISAVGVILLLLIAPSPSEKVIVYMIIGEAIIMICLYSVVIFKVQSNLKKLFDSRGRRRN